MPIAPVLQRFIDDELALAPTLIERTLAGTLTLLRGSKDNASVSSQERKQCAELILALQSHTLACERAFVLALAEGVRDNLREHHSTAAMPAAGGGLELMDESRVEIDIEISRALQLIDTTAEWELRELQTFTSTLIGQTHVSAESNPLRPQLYAAALWKAGCAVTAGHAQRALLLRVSSGVAAGLLRKAWAAACTRLEAQGVEPGIYRTVLLPAGAMGGSRGPAPPDAARAGGLAGLLATMPTNLAASPLSATPAAVTGASPPRADAPSTSPDFERALSRLDDLLRRQPGLGMNPPGSPKGDYRSAQHEGSPPSPVARDAVEGALVKHVSLQRAALIASATRTADRQVIELLGRIFDAVLADTRLPSAFVAVLARLQASALRVALREPAMFNSTQHAVWQLLDRIGEAAMAYPQNGDPRAHTLLSLCLSLVEPLAGAPTPTGSQYLHALAQLDGFLDDQLQSQQRGAQASAQALQRAEQRELLEKQLAHRLAEQIAPLRTTPTVRRFVTHTWARVLAEAMRRDGEEGESTRGYIRLVDELLWSLKLPDHPQSRQRLLALLPSLLSRLRAGMALIDLPPAEQTSMLDELMAIHAEALRPGGHGDAALTPNQIVQRMRDEVLPAATGHDGFSDSVIDLNSMETVPAALMADAADAAGADPARRVDALQTGERARIFLLGRWNRLQLLWRSEQGLYFLFAGETDQCTHSVTRRALERLVAAGLLQPMPGRSLVQRALDVVTRDAARPA